MITLYYCFGLLFYLLIFLYVFFYKEVDHKIHRLKIEKEKTGYMSNEYKLHLAVNALKMLFLSYSAVGLFSPYGLFFFGIIVLLLLSTTIKWNYRIRKGIYFIILVILFIILYDYFK